MKPLNLVRVAFAIALAGGFLLAAPARGDELAFPDDLATSPKKIADAQLTTTACNLAAVYGEKQVLANLNRCYPGTADQWSAVATATDRFARAAALFYKLQGKDAPPGACAAKVDDPTAITDAGTKVTVADAAAKAAEDATRPLQKAADDLEVQVREQQLTVDADRQGGRPRQALTDKLAQLKISLEAAKTQLAKAKADAAARRKEASDAKAALQAAKDSETADATRAVARSRMAFHQAVDTATNALTRDPADFEALLGDPDRLRACEAARDARLEAFGASAAKKQEALDDKEAATVRADAHRADLLRKAESVVSGAFSGNGFNEQPGSPDKVIFSLMSALGADSRTNGSQLVMTLNLANLYAKTEEDRLALDATWRNLMLRANLPLSASENTPPAGPATPTDPGDASADSKEEVSRFSLILGSSLKDDTDQRLDVHDRCYNAVLAYRPFPNVLDETDLAEERRDYYDICNRRAAHANRLAWRLGASFLSPSDSDMGDTDLELLGGAMVWGPQPWLYVDAFYQHVLRPEKTRVYGLGLSFAGNLGGSSSGVDSWGRLGIDVLAMYGYRLSTPASPGVGDVEFRVTPNLRSRLFGGAILKLGVGPRILADDVEHPALLASVALTYDADSLIDQVLLTPAMSP